MAGLNAEAPHPRPTVFSCGDAVKTDEDPGATLLLRCDMEEQQAITRWLVAGNRFPPGWANAVNGFQVNVDAVFLGVQKRVVCCDRLAAMSSSAAGRRLCERCSNNTCVFTAAR